MKNADCKITLSSFTASQENINVSIGLCNISTNSAILGSPNNIIIHYTGHNIY